MRRVWIILLMILCLFCSCDADVSTDKKGNVQGNTDSAVPGTPQIEEVVFETDNVFKYRKFTGENGADVYNYSIQQVGDQFWFLNWYLPANGVAAAFYYDIYDTAGNYLHNLRLPDAIQQNAIIAATPDGERFYTYEIMDADWRQFCCYDADGNLLAQSKKYVRLYPNGTKDIQDMQFFDGDLYYYRNYLVYRFPDGDITQDAQILEFPCYPDIVSLAPDGRLQVSGTIGSDFIEPMEHFLLDPETEETEKHPLTQNGRDIDTIFGTLQNFGTVYPYQDAMYALCKDGLYASRDGAAEQIVNWNESGLLPSAIAISKIMNDQFFMVSYENPLESDSEIGFLYLTEERRSQKREVVTLATIGLNREDQFFLDAAVYLFNRNSADYMIEYHNYYDSVYKVSAGGGYWGIPEEETLAAAQRQFEEDLLSGIVYDCYFFPEQSSNRDMLADKGLLADLSQYLEEDQILGCIKTAYETENGIMALPYFMRLSTLMTSQFILSPQEKLTYDVLYDMAAELKDGEALFSKSVYDSLKLTGPYEFMDLFNDTCSFGSDECEEWLSFLMEVRDGTYSDDALDILYLSTSATSLHYSVSSPFVPDEVIRSRRLKFTEITFDSFEDIAAAHWLYSRDQINFCGYPSEDETVVRLSAGATISIASNARCADGAAAFLDFLMSADVQACDRLSMRGLPVSREGMIEAFPKYVHSCLREIRETSDIQSWLNLHPDAFSLICICSDELMDELNQDGNNVFDVIKLTDEDCDRFIRFLDRAVARTAVDATLLEIVNEEMSYVENGVRTPAEAGKILQSRVGIYLAE